MTITGGLQAGPSSQTFTVFISYRRDDTGQSVEQIKNALEAGEAFGKGSVYLDTSEVAGTDWLPELIERGGHASALVFLIGPRWLDELVRRAGQDDYVRKEILWALHDWPGHIVPVLVDTELPNASKLPHALRGLLRFDARALRIGSLTPDINALIEDLRDLASKEGPVRRYEAIAARTTPAEEYLAEPDVPDGVATPPAGHYRDVLNWMLRGRVVPVLGCGAHGAPPECEQLAQGLVQTYRNAQRDPADLAEIAQRVWLLEDDYGLDTAMHDLLDAEPPPGDVHYFLARFPRLLFELGYPVRYQLIITTAYGRALETAFDEICEPYDLLVYLPGVGQGQYVLRPWGEQAAGPGVTPITVTDEKPVGIADDGKLQRTMIVKLHGTSAGNEGGFSWPEKYIVTEDHYIDYAPGNLPKKVIEKVVQSRCLFLGYHLRDWHSRVLLRRAWPGWANPSWAIHQAPDAVEATSWQKLGSTTLLSQSPGAYARTLELLLARWHDDTAIAADAAGVD